LALRKRLKASRTSAGVHGFAFFAAVRVGCGLVAARLRDFLAGLRGAGFLAGLRVIFGMFRVY
jgi:hypothetical protein